MDNDKRNYIRFRIFNELSISTDNNYYSPCELVNISQTGCCIIQKVLLYPCDVVYLRFSLDKTFTIKGEVRWTRGKEAGIYFDLIDIKEIENIKTLLRELSNYKFNT